MVSFKLGMLYEDLEEGLKLIDRFRDETSQHSDALGQPLDFLHVPWGFMSSTTHTLFGLASTP